MAIYRGIGGAGDSTTDATVTAVTEQAINSAESAAEAAASASAAASSATAAASSASAAATSKTGADTSASNAATSASAAASSASAAATSETNAASSETAAASSETAAASSASAAASSASSASTSASDASSSASAASSSASAASSSASDAADSATAAAASEATVAADAAAASASASAAATSETNAAASETNAAASESAAASSASAASTAASNASTSATAAASSASSAATSATNSASSASAASTSASNAATSETNAASSASAASSSASAASTSASNAASSASAAASSASSASASADAALAALDSFDDRYLGQKSSDPALDNDGNALVAGALYFNTTTSSMKVYDGTQWLNAYASLSGALLAVNDLSDLNNAVTARTNLGVAIGSDVQAYNANTVIDASYVHTDNNYTTTEKSKLAGIESGAQVNPTNVSAFTNDSGYLTSFTETDPIYVASSWYGTTNNATNWNTAYGWGNHASAGYVSTSGSYADPTWLTSVNYSKLTGTVPTWNQSTTGNAATATTLQTARNINGVSFNGSADITVTAAANDVYAWAKAATKPTYTYSEVDAPSTTGTNASGTWGISITGNAATVTNGLYTTSTINGGTF